MELVNLKEDDNNNYLNDEQIMEDITCSKCGLPLVKSNKMEPKKELTVVFNSKRTDLCYNELLTFEPLVYHFNLP